MNPIIVALLTCCIFTTVAGGLFLMYVLLEKKEYINTIFVEAVIVIILGYSFIGVEHNIGIMLLQIGGIFALIAEIMTIIERIQDKRYYDVVNSVVYASLFGTFYCTFLLSMMAKYGL